MDSVTQAVLGATIQGAGLGKYQGRKAYLYGAALATLPDLDVLIRYDNPITAMTTHRGFSHSVFVITAFAALLAWLICKYKPKPERGYSGRRLFIVLWLVLITHPILDSFTVYGTQLFWPFDWVPESWATIFIVDPVYTVPMLLATVAGLLFGYRRWTHVLSVAALAFSCAYLAFSVVAKNIAESNARDAMAHAGINITRMKSMPMPINTVLWQVLVDDDAGNRYEVMTGLLDDRPAEYRKMPHHPELLAMMADDPDVQRLKWFTDNWIDVVEEDGRLIVQDERMDTNGKSYFRFALAERDGDGEWQRIPTEMLPKVMGGGDYGMRFEQLWQRISTGTPFPYAEWQQATAQ
ncbi:metal-dependent hydrolase [Cardiobacteriaceae bacterium TAE3-ERU3]|nr:metal-dependent hydrolase [Cardiobacteriaceae bacterium TAE3-ERU3]